MNGRHLARGEPGAHPGLRRPAPNDDFLKNFAKDLGSLREELLGASYGVGDFAFARHGVGTRFEAFISGFGVISICTIPTNPWTRLRRIRNGSTRKCRFAELGDKLRMNPLLVTSDTQFFKK